MSVELEIKSGKATLNLLRADLNQIYTVGKAFFDGDTSKASEFKAMYSLSAQLRVDYMTKFDSLHALAINEGKDALFPTNDDIKERSLINARYYKIIEFLNKLQASETHEPSVLNRTIDTSALNQSVIRSRLPRVDLPKFTGRLTDWPKFKQLFCSMIHTNNDIQTIEKFHYLSTSLQGDPLLLISTFTINEENYSKAWDALLKRYDNNRLLASSYIDQILEYVPPKGPPSLSSMQSFIRMVAENIAALRSIKIPDEADFIWLSIALKKLDCETRHDFEISSVSTEWPKFENLIEFVQGRCRVLQLSEASSNVCPRSPKRSQHQPKPHVLTATLNQSRSKACLCTQTHQLYECPVFRGKSPSQRKSFLKDKKICFNCLRSGHIVSSCSSSGRCRKCNAQHHTMLHQDRSLSSPAAGQRQHTPTPGAREDSHSTPSSVVASVTGPVHVLLGTAIGLINDCNDTLQPVRFIIDSGSQFSLMTSSCAKRLGLTWQATTDTPLGAGGVPLPHVKGRLKCKIFSRMNSHHLLHLEPLVVGNLTGDLPSVPLQPLEGYGLTVDSLADPIFWQPREVDMLLGSDEFMKIINGTPIDLGSGYRALPTSFGLIVMGAASPTLLERSALRCHCLTESPINEELLSKFWTMEEVEEPVLPLPEDPCEEHFRRTHYRDSTGRYVVALPFKEPSDNLQESEYLALSRFKSIESKLSRNPVLKAKYSEFMAEYEELGHMSKTSSPSSYVIPHHAVFRPDDPDGKIRVVYDASASTSNGSLNSKLYVGPKLQRDIADIIMNFRRHLVAVTADLVKMYRQILITPEHRPFQHIWWRPNPDEPLQKFELLTVTYGTASAPFQANRVIKQLVIDEGHAFPLAAQALDRDIYVDDVVSGSDSIEEAVALRDQLISLLSKGGFPIHKWNSNFPELLDGLNSDSIRKSVEMSPHNDTCVAKILGMSWDPHQDCFLYSVQVVSPKVTKRSILSTVARLYDPLGFLAPVVFKAKSFLQGLWKLQMNWDDPIEGDLKREWSDFARQFPLLETIKIPRHILFQTTSEKHIIGFCDASQKGFAAAIYLRAVSMNGEVKVSLLKAKTKLAPIKTVSIPRLELCGAHLLVRLVMSIKEFVQDLNITKRLYFSDSTIVLAWLKISPQSLPTFVSNRVSYVITHTSEEEWFHVSSQDNPADVASRGLTPNLLANDPLWWAGPSWLRENPLILPSKPELRLDQVPEVKSGGITLTLTSEEPFLISWMRQYSRYRTMLRSFAYALRFINNLKCRKSKQIGPLTVEELDNALTTLILATQRHEFNDEFRWEENRPSSKRLLSLAASLDDKGVLRVGGRLQHSNLPDSTKSPVILPGKCQLVSLMIDHLHHVHFHMGQQALQAHVRRKYWIFRLRQIVKARVYKCLTCFKMRTQPQNPIMGHLPPSRVQVSRPFTNVGVDYAGPFMIKLGTRKNSPKTKAYLAVFICMATKAVHLEVVSSLSTDAFLATLNRFVARRGLPSAIYSDCGTNFVGAARHLREVFQFLKQDQVQDIVQTHAANQGFKWYFNPPYSPHFGGIWEAAVKSAKRHLHRTIRETAFHFEELTTLFARIEAILNSRPLCAMNNGENEDILTPGHFLIGAPLLSVPEPDLTVTPINRLSRWQLVSQSIQHFWKRWHVEYLHTLQKRPKWYQSTKPLKIGDIILLPDASSSPLHWRLGRIVDVHPGVDDIVRVVTIKDSRGVRKCPVHRIVSLSHLQEPEGAHI